MFTRIQSTGIGPHADLDLAISPTGRTVIRGHSEHGKSVLIDAILLVLYGVTRGGEPFDSAQMSADRVSITITSASGREYVYTRKTSPKWTYTYQGETMAQTSAKGWIDALSMARLPLWTGGPIRRDAIAICVEPLAWTRYAVSSPVESRKLRDMIVSTAGATADEAAKELYLNAGHVWTLEPMTEKAAALVVTDARRAAGEAGAKVEQARAALASVEAPVEPDTSAADALPEMAAALAEWERYDAAVANHRRQTVAAADALAQHEQRVNGWRLTCQRLGEHDADSLLRADAAHRAALSAWDEESTSRVQRHADDVAAAEAEYRAAVEARVERMAAAYDAAKRRHADAVQAAEEDYQRDMAGHADRCAKIIAEHDRAVELYSEKVARIKRDHAAAVAAWEARCEAEHAAHAVIMAERAELIAERDRWDAAYNALPASPAPCVTCGSVPVRGAHIGARQVVGAEPPLLLPLRPVAEVAGSPPVAPSMPAEPTRRNVPPFEAAPAPEREVVARTVAPLGPMRAAPVYVAPTPSPRPPEPVWTEPAPLVEPTPPTVARPDPGALEVARAAGMARRLHASAVEQHTRTVARLTDDLGKAVQLSERRGAFAEKAGAWLAAVRAAPGEVARRLEWLSKIGDGITVELPAEGPAVVIRIDGRPWRLASRGRLVCADTHLRRAFSVALGMPTLPIIVDDRQSWTGAIDVSGPVIELVTDPTAERIASIV